MRIIIILAIVFALTACKSVDETNIEEAKVAVTNSLKDPSSAQFRNVRIVGVGSLICGEVNAKNAFGGYVGFRYFEYFKKTGDVSVHEEPTSRCN